jgi:hypothetical protein
MLLGQDYRTPRGAEQKNRESPVQVSVHHASDLVTWVWTLVSTVSLRPEILDVTVRSRLYFYPLKPILIRLLLTKIVTCIQDTPNSIVIRVIGFYLKNYVPRFSSVTPNEFRHGIMKQSRCSPKYYLRIKSVPQRKHHTSPLQRSTC